MKPLGKVMLTPKGDYNSGTTYDVLDLVRYDHKSWISLKQQTGVVPTHGADWQLYTEDGNGIVNVSYVGVDPTDPDGLTDIYEISFTNTTPFQFKIRNGKDGSGGGGGASSWSDLRNKPFNTLGTDFKVDSNVLKLADAITTKLPTQAPTPLKAGYAPIIQDDGSVDWAEIKGGISEDDIAQEYTDIESATEAEKNKVVASAYAVQKYANTYTERVLMTLKAGENTIGTWQDEEPSDWVVDEDHFLFLPNFYEADDEELTFSLIFDTSNNEPIFRKGFEWVSQTDVMKDGKPCGALCIRCANAPTVDTIIGVDITRVRFDNVVVVSP